MRPPDSEPKRLPDEAGIWLRMERSGVAKVYEVVFNPKAPLRLIARWVSFSTIFDFEDVGRDHYGNWWRVP